ncbi:MAG: RNA-directed DNA polymerase [Prevotellaceae bacterium]|jgi:retron-type reverse transcriptase|nr:RNA-directed DNA polymerase [Prevotellaceae bacterium]
MKRHGYLFEHIIDMDNLRLAFYRAQRGKSSKEEIVLFRNDLDKNLLHIHNTLKNDHYHFGDYHYFTIYDPKQRTICAAPFAERVIHHAVMNVCSTLFDNHQIPYSYACRKNKGTFAAIQQAACYQKKHKWYLKLDVRKYFDSIDHAVLVEQLQRVYKDKQLCYILDQIIDSYHSRDDKGLPIGNLTSQYFANHYLSCADKYATEQLKIPAYIRYMDDILMWADSQSELIEKGLAFKDFLETKLKLILKPFILNKVEHGLPALGFIIFPCQIKLNQRSKNRFATKLSDNIHLLNQGEISETKFQQNVLALYGFINHAESKGFANYILQQTGSDTEGSNRVNRGGSWNNTAENCRVANRNNNTPSNRNNNLGFRLARSTKQTILNKCPYPSFVQEGKNSLSFPVSSYSTVEKREGFYTRINEDRNYDKMRLRVIS